MARTQHYPRRYVGHKLWLKERRDRKFGSRQQVRLQLKKGA